MDHAENRTTAEAAPTKYKIKVGRIVRADIEIEVTADTLDEAKQLAELEAQNRDDEEWEVYDCDYWSEIVHE